jgi:hypothetical protein
LFDLLVEVKHGSPESGDQLDFYASALARRSPTSSALVVLAGREFGSRATLSSGEPVKVVHWHKLAEALIDFERELTTNAWLLKEYLTYLDEEGLMPVRPIDLDAAMFAALYPRANESVKELHKLALAEVLQWGPLVTNWGGYAASSAGPNTWHTFDANGHEGGVWWEDAIFEFQFCPDDEDYVPQGRASLGFFAGAHFGKKALKPSEEWLKGMAAEGLVQYPVGNEISVLAAKYPSELIGLGTIEEQGLAVGNWAVDIFEKLRANPPS